MESFVQGGGHLQEVDFSLDRSCSAIDLFWKEVLFQEGNALISTFFLNLGFPF